MSDLLLEKLKTSEKNLFVGIAGPGTGKSTAFKTIVNSDEYKGKNILILSFINKLVDDLKSDFKEFGNITVSTLHSFAMKQMGDVEVEPSLDKIISEDYSYLKSGVADFGEKLRTNDLSEEEERFYKERKNFYKNQKNLYSLDSVIYAANKFLELHEDKIGTYDLILIDEFQDFNQLEYGFIQLLNKKSKVVLVGDDNQSLYFFKKAEPKLIRDLYNASHTEEFSLDFCFRCTEVIVDATNDLVKNAKAKGFLNDGLDKNFSYPKGIIESKDKLSEEFSKIDFIPAVAGDLLIYKIEQNIKNNLKGKGKKRVLILVPGYLKQTIYDGLIKKDFNIVEFELFFDEKCKDIKHRDIVSTFNTLAKRKTDNLALRMILGLYLNGDEIMALILENKKIWSLLSADVRAKIEADIALLKKVQKGKDALTEKELLRFNKVFSLKNVLSRLVKGFTPVAKDAIQIEMTTVMSSKGLSADYVYYVGIDDKSLMDRTTKKFTDQKICEFLVGITRAKEKLVLISLSDQNPKILDFLNQDRINRIDG